MGRNHAAMSAVVDSVDSVEDGVVVVVMVVVED